MASLLKKGDEISKKMFMYQVGRQMRMDLGLEFQELLVLMGGTHTQIYVVQGLERGLFSGQMMIEILQIGQMQS